MNQDRFRILICSTSIAQYDRRMQRIAKTLMGNGYEVKWISRGTKGKSISGIPHIQINPIFASGFLFYAFFNLRLLVNLLFRSYDVVYSVDLDTVLPCYLSSKIKSKKIVFDSHEFFTEVPELLGRNRVKKVWERIANFCLPKIKNNYTVGSSLSKIFTERYNQPYEIIRNVPISKKQNFENKSDGITMVYLGMVNKGRGVEIAIESLVELKNKCLKIIGGGDIIEEMKILSQDLGVDDRVDFRGYILPDKIDEELSGCWIAINLLMPMSKSYYYSLANKFFDYMHVNLPTINMDFPEYRIINKKYKTGLLVDEYGLKSFVDAVRGMENEQIYIDCLKGIKEAKSRFNWETEQETLLKFFSSLT